MPSEIRRIMRDGKGRRAKRLLVCILHVILWPILLIPRLFWPRRSLKTLPQAPRILLIRIDGIGDLTMTTPIFPALRNQYPGGRIDLLTSNVAEPIGRMLLDAKWIDSLFVMPLLKRTVGDHRRMARQLRAQKYDAAIDLRGDARNVMLMWLSGAPLRYGVAGSGLSYLLTESLSLPPRLHQVDETAELVRRLGVNQVDPQPRLPLRQQDQVAAEQWLAQQNARDDQPIAAFHLGAFQPAKIWPLERFIEVARSLREEMNAQLLVVGGKSELPLAEEFSRRVGGPVAIATGQAPLPLAAALLSRAAVFIGNDSGPAHIAAAVGCPIVVLFGNGDPRIYTPRSPHAVMMKVPRPCWPGCGGTCTRPEAFCMLEFTPDAVASAAKLLMESSSRMAPSAPQLLPSPHRPQSFPAVAPSAGPSPAN